MEKAEREKAAVRIQAIHRGKNDRRKSKILRLEQDSKMREMKEKELMEIRSRELKQFRDKDLKAERKGLHNQAERTPLTNTDQAATKIQKLARRRERKKNSNSPSSDGRGLSQDPVFHEKVISSAEEAAGNLELNGLCTDASQSQVSPTPNLTPRKTPRYLSKPSPFPICYSHNF